MTGSDALPSFRLGYVPGVTPGKWARIWRERSPEVPLTLVQVPAAEAADLVRDRAADGVVLRLPIDRTGLHAIPLYTETTVVVVPKQHFVTAADEVSTADLAEEAMLRPIDDTLDWERPPGQATAWHPVTTAEAVELVAARAGLLVVPQSLARLYHRKDVTYRPVSDAPTSSVALSWLADETTDLMEQFIGIVRGRTVNSTRGRQSASAKSERPDTRKPADGKQAGRNRRGGSSGAKDGRRAKRRRRS